MSEPLLQHAQFFSTAQTVFCVIGFEGSFRQINAGCEKALGYNRATLLKTEFINLVHPSDKKTVEQILEELSSSHEIKTFNCQIIDANQKYRDFIWQATPSLKEFAFYAVGIEISDYKHHLLQEANAEAHDQLTAAQEKNADLQLLVEELQQKVPTVGDDAIPIAPLFQLVQEGVIFQHRNGNIYAVNEKQVKHILGSIPDPEQFTMLWEVAKNNSNPEIPIKFSWIKKTGKVAHLHLCAQTITDMNKQIFGKAISFIDITEQQILKTKIDFLQEQTTLVSQTHNEGILTWDLLTHEVTFSGSWKKLLGYREEDTLFGKRIETWYSRIHPTEYNQVVDALKCYLDGNCAKFEIEHRVSHKDGHYRWMLVRGRALRDRSGYAYRFIGTFTDITERRSIAENITNNQLLSPMLNSLPEAFLIVDTSTYKIVAMNSAACKLYKYEANEFEHLFIYQLYSDRMQFDREWQLMLKDNIYHIPATFQRKKSGETFVADISGGYYEWQRKLLIILVIRDITARRNIEQVIREERQQYGTAFHNAPFMILCKDNRGKIIKANRFAGKLFNKRPEQLVGLFERDLNLGFSEKYYDIDNHILQTGEQILGLIEEYNGRVYHIDKIPYRDAAGRILGILVFIIDVESHLNEHTMKISP